ncbi:unnamed protein product, partial [Nippostrongylus brasiliensis]|uniref:Uncharacterized protein n=1 Tax=Nippostrongylus brasiliensis TaxID=27835 RepID=A0A0N4XPB6_NIPBR
MNFMRRSLRRLAGDSQRRSESIDIAMFHSLDTVTATGGAEGLQEPSCAQSP